jgi:hypothetical protein
VRVNITSLCVYSAVVIRIPLRAPCSTDVYQGGGLRSNVRDPLQSLRALKNHSAADQAARRTAAPWPGLDPRKRVAFAIHQLGRREQEQKDDEPCVSCSSALGRMRQQDGNAQPALGGGRGEGLSAFVPEKGWNDTELGPRIPTLAHAAAEQSGVIRAGI